MKTIQIPINFDILSRDIAELYAKGNISIDDFLSRMEQLAIIFPQPINQ